MWFGFAEKYPTVNAFLVFPIKYPWKLTPLVDLYCVTFTDTLAANFTSVTPTHWQSSFWQVYFFTFPLHFTILKMKQEAICFLVWDILDFFHMWNNKNIDWGFFSLMLLEETWRHCVQTASICSPYRRCLLWTECSFVSLGLT